MITRLEQLIGNQINNIIDKKILVIGLGGVGSYAVESLVRSGIKKIIIVDNDKVDITNLNRQLMTNTNNIGEDKVDVWYSRIKAINPNCEVIKIKQFINNENIDLLFNEEIDYLVDACDTINTKKEIIKKCLEKKIKFISVMGMANKIDATKIKICDIRKTSYDPIAKIIRKMVKDEHLKGKVTVVYSDEIPIKCSGLGSTSYVPATAGLFCTNYIINDILEDVCKKN